MHVCCVYVLCMHIDHPCELYVAFIDKFVRLYVCTCIHACMQVYPSACMHAGNVKVLIKI